MGSAGLILVYVGIAFLVLGLLIAVREVFFAKPASVPSTESANESTISDIAALIETIGKLKRWLALSVIGLSMICLGSLMTGNNPLSQILVGSCSRETQAK